MCTNKVKTLKRFQGTFKRCLIQMELLWEYKGPWKAWPFPLKL